VLGRVLKKALMATYKSFSSVSSRPDQLSLTVMAAVCQAWRSALFHQHPATLRNLFRRTLTTLTWLTVFNYRD